MATRFLGIAELKLCTESTTKTLMDIVSRGFGLYQCCLCNQYPFTLCVTCAEKILFSTPECSICREFSETATIHHICRIKALAYTHCFSCFCYTKPIKALFHTYKYDCAFQYQRAIKHLLDEYFRIDPFLLLKKWNPTFYKKRVVLLPVPMTRHKQEERGFSPAYELAVLFGRLLQARFNMEVYVCTTLLKKNIDSEAQARKNKKKRLLSLCKSYSLIIENVRDFLLQQPDIVCVVDDVLTTGATTTTILDQLSTDTDLKVFLKTIPLVRIAFASA